MTFGSLFAGIGGFDLGFERAGMTCKWQVEIDPFCRKVLEKHWPDVRRHDDVRTFPPEGDWGVDVICGGFPCQDISNAGKRAGITGERSGLWTEYARIIRHLRPRYVVVENVAALLVRGMDTVLGDLAAIGFDAEWDVLPAAAFGHHHLRERVFVVAYTNGERLGKSMAQRRTETRSVIGNHIGGTKTPISKQLDYWKDHSEVLATADEIPGRMDELRGLGNAVVPQVAEWIGRRIVNGFHQREQQRLSALFGEREVSDDE